MIIDKRLQNRLNKYGLSAAEYLNMLESCDNKCMICMKPPKKGGRPLHIDHDHKSGKVRGLLCFMCNSRLIGRFGDREDSVQLYERAAEYLRKAKQ